MASALNPRRWRYGYAWLTLAFFAFSLFGHWIFAWFAYVQEQVVHGQPIQVSDYVVQVTRDTFENWQSEFLQLLWQVGGLAILLHVGSPQSKRATTGRRRSWTRSCAGSTPTTASASSPSWTASSHASLTIRRRRASADHLWRSRAVTAATAREV
jgi:hypothetical protein